MKIVYVFHNKFRELDPILLLRESDSLVLTENELEAVFKAHNFSIKRKLPALTGFFEWESDKMGIIDPDTGLIYFCKVIGWEII